MSNTPKTNEPRGWYSRGYLPRFDPGSLRTQFVTCRLHDSLPQNVLALFNAELRLLDRAKIDRERLLLMEQYLDRGYGECYLRIPAVATIIRDSLLRFDGVRYKLHAWVIMPNHIHLLLTPIPGFTLEKILHSFKSFTAQEANRFLEREGRFWMREAFDRYIRDADHYGRAFRYIENNPVKAGFCDSPEKWVFGSAWERAATEHPDTERRHPAGNNGIEETERRHPAGSRGIDEED